MVKDGGRFKAMKKKFISCLLLALYSLAFLKPIAPLVNDLLAHTFWKMQHLATVHYENGKYHLHNELKTASNEDSSNRKAGSLTSDETLALHLGVADLSQLYLKTNQAHNYPKTKVNLVHFFPGKDSPPPQYC